MDRQESQVVPEDKVQKHCGGFPGGPGVKNPPADAGDTSSVPGLGGSHMPQSNEARAPQVRRMCSRARGCSHALKRPKPTCPGARTPQQEKAPHQRVAPAPRNQREARTAAKSQHSPGEIRTELREGVEWDTELRKKFG